MNFLAVHGCPGVSLPDGRIAQPSRKKTLAPYVPDAASVVSSHTPLQSATVRQHRLGWGATQSGAARQKGGVKAAKQKEGDHRSKEVKGGE